MKILFLSILSIFLFIVNPVNSDQKIVFINMQKVLETSNSGSSVLKQLNDINNKNLMFLKKEEKKFTEKETKLISQKNIITESDFQNKINDLKTEIKKYNQNKEKIITDFNKLKVDNTNKLLQLINPLLHSYAKDKSIEIILQKKNIILGKTALDITDQIILIINKEIKEFKIK